MRKLCGPRMRIRRTYSEQALVAQIRRSAKAPVGRLLGVRAFDPWAICPILDQ